MPVFSARAWVLVPVLLAVGACSDSPRNPPPVTGTAPAVTTAPVVAVPGIATPPVAASPILPVTPPPVVVAPGSGTTVAPAIAGGRMSANDIAATVNGNTITGISTGGQPYYALFAPDGRIRFRQGTFQDVGSWRLTADGRLCSTLSRINDGNETCYLLYRSGNSVRFTTPNGIDAGTFTVVLGNPQNL
jgi:hypothetical protein